VRGETALPRRASDVPVVGTINLNSDVPATLTFGSCPARSVLQLLVRAVSTHRLRSECGGRRRGNQIVSASVTGRERKRNGE
jgi:hypothetical protein